MDFLGILPSAGKSVTFLLPNASPLYSMLKISECRWNAILYKSIRKFRFSDFFIVYNLSDISEIIKASDPDVKESVLAEMSLIFTKKGQQC